MLAEIRAKKPFNGQRARLTIDGARPTFIPLGPFHKNFLKIWASDLVGAPLALPNHLTYSLCNKRHELAENFLSLILINLVPKVASNCE